VDTNSSKVKVVQDWHVPINTKKVRGILRLTRYYRKIIQHYSLISRTLLDLHKDTTFHWTTTEQQTFDHLKRKMLETPVLTLLDFSVHFNIETSSYKRCVGEVLMQSTHVVAYLRKSIGHVAQTLSTYEK
jgi:hypothetical protein